MCAKLPFRDFNSNPYPSHPTSIYTYGVIFTLRVCSDSRSVNRIYLKKNEID